MSPPTLSAPGRATWLWDAAHLTPRALDFLGAQRVTEVFLGVPWAGPDAAVRRAAADLRARGLRITCLGGDPGWAHDHRLAAAWAKRAIDSGLFAGAHLDVEPWTLPEWPARKAPLLAGLQRAVEAVATLTPTEMDLPGWLARDHSEQFSSLLRAASQITVLAYRDRADAIESEAAAAAVLAVRFARPFRIGVETRPAAEPQITFADDGRTVLDRELAVVVDRLGRRPGNSGVAIHDLASWLALRP